MWAIISGRARLPNNPALFPKPALTGNPLTQ
jgi:hypothetical protein